MSPTSTLNDRRRQAVKLKLEGMKLADISAAVDLSQPTIINAHKAFQKGGWEAVNVRPAGRLPGHGKLSPGLQASISAELLNLKPQQLGNGHSLMSYTAVRTWLKQSKGTELTLRAVTRYCEQWGISADNLHHAARNASTEGVKTWWSEHYQPAVRLARREQKGLFWISSKKITHTTGTRTPGNRTLLFAQTPRGSLYWITLSQAPRVDDYLDFFQRLQQLKTADDGDSSSTEGSHTENKGKGLGMVFCGIDINAQPALLAWLDENNTHYIHGPGYIHDPGQQAGIAKNKRSKKTKTGETGNKESRTNDVEGKIDPNQQTTTESASYDARKTKDTHLMQSPESESSQQAARGHSHLNALESESIHIMREVVAEANNPVMLFSSGKDSAVMLHLALKAFYPAKPPFPLLHIDTKWEFKAMYEHRDKIIKKHDLELMVQTNQEGVEKNVNPFSHGTALYTDLMKTEALKQALDKHGFDIAIGGARRDEEKSRSKERVFSFRSVNHRWNPKAQRPEIWNLYNTRVHAGESIRAFPLSNWTELDIWNYIHREQIEISPLYFAADRPVVERDGSLIMMDDDRLTLRDGEVPVMRSIRFRTLGCYPLTAAFESTAASVSEIVAETLITTTSERSGRLIDHDAHSSMEKKKQEGYF